MSNYNTTPLNCVSDANMPSHFTFSRHEQNYFRFRASLKPGSVEILAQYGDDSYPLLHPEAPTLGRLLKMSDRLDPMFVSPSKDSIKIGISRDWMQSPLCTVQEE